MRFALTILIAMSAGPAMAHIGHLGEVAGHGHWLGAAALGAAIALGLWQGLKGKAQAQGEDDADDATDEEPQEA